MNRHSILWIILLFVAGVCASCSSSTTTPGIGLIDDEEAVVVGCDTFSLRSKLREGEFIYTTPDSFLLGECETLFGTLHADILTQLVCPEGFEYPANAEVDSVCMFVYYTTWYGDGLTPLSLNVYEMDGEVMQYTGTYSSGDSISRFCSKKTCLVNKPRIVVAKRPTDSIYNSSTSTYTPYIKFRMTDEFCNRFFAIKDFSDQDRFNQQFKGLYITSEFGGATILHVPEISMAVYYHYDYHQLYDTTTYTEIDVKGFYANREVRQINHYELIDPQLKDLSELDDDIDFIVSPGYIFTELNIPLRHMGDSILAAIGNKRTYINQAKISVEILNPTDEEENPANILWAQPSNYMLLIKADAVDRFFSSNELPSDTCALLQSISIESDSLDQTYYCYSYDLSSLLTQQLRRQTESGESLPDTLKMVLVPVDVTTTATSSTSTAVTAVKHKQTISATVIRSANIQNDPMQLEVVYSGF